MRSIMVAALLALVLHDFVFAQPSENYRLPNGQNVPGHVAIPQPVTYTPLLAPTVPPGASTLELNSVVTGCRLVNMTGSVLYVDQTGAGASTASFPVQNGGEYVCPAPSTQPLSVYSAAGGSIAGFGF